ncbi:MAG: hypothetical protein P8Y73_12750 [Desulfuromonadales bacterium]|jgi:hypothetical protein
MPDVDPLPDACPAPEGAIPDHRQHVGIHDRRLTDARVAVDLHPEMVVAPGASLLVRLRPSCQLESVKAAKVCC